MSVVSTDANAWSPIIVSYGQNAKHLWWSDGMVVIPADYLTLNASFSYRDLAAGESRIINQKVLRLIKET